MDFQGVKYIVVGAGLSGSVIAEQIADDLDEKVVVIEKRQHSGGNCYSEVDRETGIEVHKYGTHVFHTRHSRAWEYLTRFTSLNHYRHRVYTSFKNRVYPLPINLDTINRFFGENFDPEGARVFLAEKITKDCFPPPQNLEEHAVSMVGRELYDAFIKGYTRKQWNLDPALLPAEIIARIPFRYSYHADYFDDPFQGLPLEGYAGLFGRLLSHRNIEVRLGVDFFAVRDMLPKGCTVIFTGPIDRYFDCRFGALGWRSLRFEFETVAVDDYQGTSVLNYADVDIPHTRSHEFKHLHPERETLPGKTIVAREFPCDTDCADNDPCYPVNTARDRAILRQYRQAADAEAGVIFCGRLGSYRYCNMDEAIVGALDVYLHKIKPAEGR